MKGLVMLVVLVSIALVHADHHQNHATVSPTGYSGAELDSMRASAEHHAFQAEVSQLLDILVNSLYSNRDVFLRELISNGSDALSKIRFASLTDASVLGTTPELAIYVKADIPNRILHIIDTGVGMTRADMVENLGRIAKSGTKEFLNALSSSDDSSNLIGKFGVGFYSAFLVADIVRVTSKNNDDKQWVWESTADGSFTVTEDPKGNTLGRGTQVSLLLKEGFDEYLDESNVEQLVHKYSEFVNYPIFLWTSHEVEVPVPKPVKDDDKEQSDSPVDLEEEEDEDEEDDEDAAPATETVEVWEWERINAVQPLWTRDPADISQEQYDSFYKSISNDFTAPMAHSHFSAEGDINFRSILFVPSSAPDNLFGGSREKKPLKLFVKRVFINDDFEDMMPKYLSFIHGIVDSDDLDLNVSREVLQQSKTLGVIQKKLVRKAISMFQEMAQDDPEKYQKFFGIFGTNLKWGYLEDKQNKARLEKLMRFASSKVDGLTGFDDYVERMQEGQDQIFYIAGDSKDALVASPLLEKLTKRGFEVLFMTEPIDEYVTQSLTRFGDHPMTNLAKEGFKIDGDEEEDQEELNDKFSGLISFIKTSLGHNKVANVVLSNRLESVPATLVSGQWGWTANMERIAKAQALADKSQTLTSAYKARRIMEINPNHPTILALQQRFAVAGAQDETLTNLAQLIYHSALLTSGFELDDPADLSHQLQRVMIETLTNAPAPVGHEDAIEDDVL